MASTRHDNFIVELTAGPHGPGALTVTSARGRERVSGGYSFEVHAHTDLDPKKLASVLGGPARLVLGPSGKERVVSGIIAGINSVGETRDDFRRSYSFRLVPRWFRLRHRRDSRIFQHSTLEQIVGAVLDTHGVAHRFQRSHVSPIREYVTQFEETDQTFVQRLLAEAGLFFHFEQPSDANGGADKASATETMVIADEPSSYFPIGDERTLRIHADRQMVRDDETVHRFSERLTLRPESAMFRDYDPGKPGTDLRAVASVGRPSPCEIYEHGGRHLEAGWDHEQGRAALRLGQARKLAQVSSGTSSCMRLSAGAHFALEDERGGGEYDGEYVVTHVSHQVTATAGHGASYVNSFRVVPRTVAFVPTPKRRRRVSSCLTATVVGPKGEEIFVNGLGQIMVQFAFDRQGRSDEHSSCWLRVLQAWAGSQFGVQFTPRVGMEVLVGFDGGDPNKPVVLGTVANGTHGQPFGLKDKSKSGIVTKTYGGVGSNALVFDDAKGKETLELRGQRMVTVSSGDDYRLSVGGRAVTVVSGNLSSTVKGSHKDEVDGIRMSVVNGSRVDVVNGPFTETIGGNANSEVRGDFVVKAKQRLVLSGETGMSLTVGSPKQTGEGGMFVYGRASVGASDTVQINALHGVTILCGTSELKILPDKIVLNADTIELKAKKGLSASSGDKGPSLVINEEATLSSKKITLLGEKGTIRLDDKGASMSGDDVAISAAPEERPKPKDEEEEKKTKKMIVQLTDADMKPIAGKKYHVLVKGQTIEGTTDGDGVVEQLVPRSADAATIVLWTDTYPTGPQRRYDVELLAAMPPVDSVRGAKLRMRNLGYYAGAIDDDDNADYAKALVALQVDFGLDRTGKLDAPTIEKLEYVHTS